MSGRKIDVHTHLGDILYGKDILLSEEAPEPSGYYEAILREREEHYLREDFRYPGDPFVIEKTKPEDYPQAQLYEDDALGLEAAFTARNYSASLKNWLRAMDRCGIDRGAVLPVQPQIGFADLSRAVAVSDRVIPFTSIDFRLGEQAGPQLLRDVAAGAKGLKLHPIIQKASLDDPRLREALVHWSTTGLPVLSHIGVAEYYPPEESHRDEPKNGAIEPFLRLVNDFPDLNFIAGHSGNESWHILLEAFVDRRNVWIDTSLATIYSLRQFYQEWGAERILFGSDWPWLRPEASCAVIEKAIADPTDREKIFWQNSAGLLKL